MPDHSAPTALFFDLDDTLLDDRAASDAGLRTLTHRLGHPDPAAARHLWDTQTATSFEAYLDGRLTITGQRRERVRALAAHAGHPPITDDHADTLYQHYLDAHRSAWRAFDDVTPTLDALAAAGLRLGIITNGIAPFQHRKLAALGIDHHFPTVVCADTAARGKPDPRMFHTACTHLGVAPDHAWHIGDHPTADARGALGAGLRPFLLDRHGTHPAIPGVTTISTLAALPALATAGTRTESTPARPA